MPTDWEKIRASYISTTKSLQEISKEYVVNFYYLKRKAANENWYEQKKEYQSQLHQEVSKRLLENLKSEAQNTVERNIARAESWRYMQVNLIALAQGLKIIDPLTGLPSPNATSELERKAKILNAVSQGLERSFVGERLELGQNLRVDDVDVTLDELKTYAKEQKKLQSKSLEELEADLEKLYERRERRKRLDKDFPLHNNVSR